MDRTTITKISSPPRALQTCSRSEEIADITSAKQQVLGIDHAETGAFLLEEWNLPSCVAEVTRWNHQPEFLSADTLVIDLVHVADSMCLMGGIGAGLDGANYRTSPEVISGLNLKSITTDAVIPQFMNRLVEVCGLFAPVG